MKYSLDTSAILDRWNRYYPQDVFPTVWRMLEYMAWGGKVLVTEEVFRELERQDDGVYKWVRARESHLVVPMDGPIQVEARRILDAHPKLVNTQKNRHLADPFVIALARVENAIVVSGEWPSRNLERPKVPDVCAALGIRHMRLVNMLREEGISI